MLKYRYQKLRDCMVGSWCPSLGATGPLLLDRSGRGNHGTLTNMDPGTDWVVSAGGNRSGWALDFDGVNDFVDCGNPPAIAQATRITVSCWVQPASTGRSDLVSKWQSGVGLQKFVLLQGVTTSQFGFFCSSGSGGVGAQGFNFTTGIWYHVAGTYDGSNIRLWVNGQNVATTAASINLANGSANVYIGKSYDAIGPSRIDAVTIHDTALTQSDIATLARYRGIEHETYRTVTVRGADVGGGTTYNLGNVDSRSSSVSGVDAVGVIAPLVNRDSRSSSVSGVDSLTVSAGLANRDSRSVTVSGVDAVALRAGLGNQDSRSVTVSHASDVTIAGGAIDLGNVDSRSVTVSARDAMSVQAAVGNVDSRSATLSDMVSVALRAGLGNRDSRSDSRSGVDGLTTRVGLANRDSRSETRSGVDNVTLVGAAQEQSFFLTDYSTLEPA